MPILLVAMVTLFLPVTSLHAQQLPDAEWMAYFGSGAQLMEFKVSIINPFAGPQDFIQREKPKGQVFIDNKEYSQFISVSDSGPFANQITKTFTRVSVDGLYQRGEDTSERLLVPRPLTIGQTWNSGDEIRTFEGIEGFETFNATIPSCAKITGISEIENFSGEKVNAEHTMYYERGKGQIYKASTGLIPFTKILSEYAGKK